MTKTATEFTKGCARIRAALFAFPGAKADTPHRPGGWTRKQVLGHILDSAANNHQRFVRAALEGHYTGPFYDQNGWVELHGYADLPWQTLLDRSTITHQMLEQVVTRIPEDRLNSLCTVGDVQPVTL